MSITCSDTYGIDISKADPKQRTSIVSDTVQLARSVGIQVVHRRKGWSTRLPGADTMRHWWPADVNLFVDYVEDEARKLEAAKQ